jgi:hypothetical protein
MLEARGKIDLTDTQKASIVLFRRVAKSRPLAIILLGLGVAFAGGGSILIVDHFAPGSDGLAVAATVAVFASAMVIMTRLRLKAFYDSLVERGVSRTSAAAYRLGDDGLLVSGENMEMLIRWPGVSEVAPGHGFWCVVGPGAGFCLPRAFFETPDLERAFIRGMLERMSESARARSREARDFLGVWG